MLHIIRPSAVRYRSGLLAVGAVLGVVTGFAVAMVLATALRAMALAPARLSMAVVLTCTVLFAWSGAALFYRPSTVPFRRLPWLRLAGLLLFLVAISIPNLHPFPARGSIAEREAWARRNVSNYAGLVHIVAAVPEVVADVGRIVAVAPTANDRHVYAKTMNGDEMRFALDVVGDKGSGVFRVVCTVLGNITVDWSDSRWVFGGRETRIPQSPAPFSRPEQVTGPNARPPIDDGGFEAREVE
jgi:hypothetical protein